VLVVAMALLMGPAGVVMADEPLHSAAAAGHADPTDTSAANFADQHANVDSPPAEMHFCWTNCFTLRFEDGVYRRADRSDETWSVERFDSEAVVLHRHDPPTDWNGFSTDVVYRGQVVNNRWVNVSVNGNPVPAVNLAWGFALDSLPGSNVERERRRSAQAQSQAIAQPEAMARPATLAVDSESSTDHFESANDGEASVAEAPPPLLAYDQTPCPQDGYLWTPGYWSWGGSGYFWVPGAWLEPPRAGVLWTPGYWGYLAGIYVFHAGYWGPHVGYYGGINYGYGYFGSGFSGGRWQGNSFAYNRAVSNLGTSVTHATYSESMVANVTASQVSYNGGPGGTTATRTAEEKLAAAEPHLAATPRQRQIVAQSRAQGAHPRRSSRGCVHDQCCRGDTAGGRQSPRDCSELQRRA
jgi:hypothetical protein